MSLKILKEPNHELRLKSQAVKQKEILDNEIQVLIDQMIETMKVNDGIGLAAPQVGVRKKIIIVETKKGPEAFINPRISRRSFFRTTSEEGCLSIPGVYGMVKRFSKVTIKAFNRDGGKVKMRVGGLEAVIFQHEIDHLDGILFTDKVNRFTSPPRL